MKNTHTDTTYLVYGKAQQSAMQCHAIILDTTCTTYTFYEIEKRKETKKTHEQRRRVGREEETKIKKVEETNCRAPPPQAMWQTLEKNDLEKKRNKKKKTSLLVNRVGERTKEK